MTGVSGAAAILRFNWPWFAAAAGGSALSLCMVAMDPGGIWPIRALVAVLVADAWLLLSLAVSHVIYDRSGIAQGAWLEGVEAARIAIIHAGHDEATKHVLRQLPDAVRSTFDIFDPAHGGAPSLQRARNVATVAAPAAAVGHLPLPDACVEVVLVIFAAHEVRVGAARTALFRELGRIAGAHGRIIVVEHQRDWWNLLAYGPGCLHFLSHGTWLGTFSAAGLVLAGEAAITPWVHRFELRCGA